VSPWWQNFQAGHAGSIPVAAPIIPVQVSDVISHSGASLPINSFPAACRTRSVPGNCICRGYYRSVTFERITTDPAVMGGLPCIRGLRFPVATVVAMVADGMTNDEILAEHPDLTREDIHESLLYAAEAVRERELPLRHSA
jgi:uncharacterized protein (DUF433 family)